MLRRIGRITKPHALSGLVKLSLDPLVSPDVLDTKQVYIGPAQQDNEHHVQAYSLTRFTLMRPGYVCWRSLASRT